MENEAVRRHRVDWALKVTKNTSLEPTDYERDLLEQYVEGLLTLDDITMLLDSKHREV